MSEAVHSRSSLKLVKTTLAVAITTIALLYVASYLIVWSRQPSVAGACPANTAEWQQAQFQHYYNTLSTETDKTFRIHRGAKWDDHNRLWVVPFTQLDDMGRQRAHTALIDCNGLVELEG